MEIDWHSYPCDGHYDELVASPGGARQIGELPAPVRRRRSAARRLGPYLRFGPGARRRRHPVRPRGQSARTLRRFIHAWEPSGLQARRPASEVSW